MIISHVIQMEINADRMKHLSVMMMKSRPYEWTMSDQSFLVLFIVGSMIWSKEELSETM